MKILKIIKPLTKRIPEKPQEILVFWFKETPAEKRFKKNEHSTKLLEKSF